MSTADIPLVGGPADGTVITVELDHTGRPPLTHRHIGTGRLADAEVYELESVAGDVRLWLYRCRTDADAHPDIGIGADPAIRTETGAPVEGEEC